MAFTDLPPDFSDLPLTGSAFVADVLDLVVSQADRQRGALAVLLCDDAGRLRAPVVVGELPVEMSDDDRERVLATCVAAVEGCGSVLVAVARATGLSVREDDHAWARAAARAFTDGPRLLGVHVVTHGGSREVPVEAG